MRAGVVVRVPEDRSRPDLPSERGRAFVEAREVRGIVVPELVRMLGVAGGARVGVAVVDGKLHAAFDLGGDAAGPIGALVVGTESRGETFVALGLEVLSVGRFDPAPEDDGVLFEGAPLPRASLLEALRAIDQAAWAAHGALGMGHLAGSDAASHGLVRS